MLQEDITRAPCVKCFLGAPEGRVLGEAQSFQDAGPGPEFRRSQVGLEDSEVVSIEEARKENGKAGMLLRL